MLGFLKRLRKKPKMKAQSPSIAMKDIGNHPEVSKAFIKGLQKKIPDVCFDTNCDYIGPHRHGTVCDFKCWCGKGQGIGDVARG